MKMMEKERVKKNNHNMSKSFFVLFDISQLTVLTS